jgi:molybdopterin/thiamine biosynthesis adenylyltransferase
LIWWVDQPLRAQQERSAIGDLAERSDWLGNVAMKSAEGLRLAFDFEITVAERTIPLTLVYPDFFPDVAPSILARDRQLLSLHQYGPEGELCLEHRPDNWTPEVTGAMMIESAHRLLATENETGVPAPADHQTTRAQRMRRSSLRLLFSVDTLEGLSRVAAGNTTPGMIEEQTAAGTTVAELSRIGPEDAPIWTAAARRGGEARSLEAVIVRATDGEARPIRNFADLRGLLWSLGLAGFATELAGGSEMIAVLVFDGRSLHAAVVFGDGGDRKAVTYDATFAEPEAARLDPEYERLRGARVAIVGCGSIGSKVAVQLARSGVGGFVLVDGDVLASGNLVRNELDWRSVGVHKAPALGARILEVNASCAIDARTTVLGGQESGVTVAATMARIEECDLIVDATADAKVFNLCAAIARRANKAMCWAQVFGGGIGGIVVRLRPGIDPTPLAARACIEAQYREWNVEWPEDGSAQPYGGAGDGGPPLIADDADVSVIASHLSRFAIDLLARPDATIFPHPAYVIGMAQRWLFTEPFDVRPIDLGEADAWETVSEPGDSEALRELIAELVPARTDAH